jgi:hypothetical protein
MTKLFIIIGALVVAAIWALSVSAHAQTLPTDSAGPGQYAVSIASVTSLNVPEFAASAMICVEGASARYIDDSVTTPTATVGIPVTASTCFSFGGPLAAFRIIGGSGSDRRLLRTGSANFSRSGETRHDNALVALRRVRLRRL